MGGVIYSYLSSPPIHPRHGGCLMIKEYRILGYDDMDYSTEHKKNFKKIFNRFVGSNGQPFTPASLSLLTDIPKNTIHSHMNEYGSMPSIPCLILYMKVFNVSFADAILSYAGLSVARADEHEAPTTHQAQSALARTMHKVAVALEDGEIDDSEKKDLSPVIRQTAQDLTALANEYDGEKS